ncbi:hypothetical protein K491DRAFT_696082 [Lophiostoma macrostomum CBS 122681]|uniref:Uncharacterized protein n=1 Tax=Lophiostoma macrostomum CBS 122681 TaxID=1314788 RepID=A0A6A6T069_9PLEO|nr:hypothetical protein K491DRAFT_696082 [Lophiostoma macrostomum CBS 122681]
MEPNLLSPTSAKPPQGFGAQVIRTDTDETATENESYGTRAGRRDSDQHAPDSPPAPYDPPDGSRNAGDIAMQQLDEPPYSTGGADSPSLKKGDYGSLSNFQYDSDNRSLISTAKRYDHQESRKFLFKTGMYRFSITLMFCILIGLSLKAYEGFRHPIVISRNDVRIFNALMLGLSLGLGLNLASSLKRYAVILRWSLLTKRYVSLEVFDLILGLETLTKVGKLLVISLPGIRKVRFLRKLPWFREARDDGTRFTWIVCLLWILVNIGAQVLVAALSLFWPVDPSDSTPLLTYGNVSVSDLVNWKVDAQDASWNGSAMEAAWNYGTEASMYPVFQLNDTQDDLSSLAGTPLYHGNGYYEYRFLNRNPDHAYTNYLVSTRSVRAKATCVQATTKGDVVDVGDDPLYVEGQLDGESDWTHYLLPQVTTGSISWIGAMYEYCGPRCTNFTVFQDSDDDKIKHNSLFLCNSTLSDVTGGEEDFTSTSNEDKKHLYGTDDFARIASGSIAWTGYISNSWYDRSSRSYLRGSKWSPYKEVTKEEVEDMLARFTIGSIAAFDDHGTFYTVQNQYTKPVQGQQLTVDWAWVLGLLGGIVVIQAAALVALLAFANKSIIRDESFFSLAMLLSPVVNRIGREGMNLSGDEIKTHPKLLWKRIRYDYREGQNGEPNQVDIFFEGKDMWESRRSWASGVYS